MARKAEAETKTGYNQSGNRFAGRTGLGTDLQPVSLEVDCGIAQGATIDLGANRRVRIARKL